MGILWNSGTYPGKGAAVEAYHVIQYFLTLKETIENKKIFRYVDTGKDKPWTVDLSRGWKEPRRAWKDLSRAWTGVPDCSTNFTVLCYMYSKIGDLCPKKSHGQQMLFQSKSGYS